MPQSLSLYRSQPAYKSHPTQPATAPSRNLRSISAQPLSIVYIDDRSEGALNAALRARRIAKEWRAPVHVLSASPNSFATTPPTVFTSKATRLLVTHIDEGRRPFEWLLETPAEQLLRRFSIPVLIVKQPVSMEYGRALVAAKLESQASELIAATKTMSPRARVDVVHVLATSYEYKLRLADAPEAAVRAYRMGAYRDAYGQMNGLIASAGGHQAGAIVPRIASGNPPHRLLELALATHADLIVLGKQPRHWLGDLFLDRGIARRVLSEAQCDVLLIPCR